MRVILGDGVSVGEGVAVGADGVFVGGEVATALVAAAMMMGVGSAELPHPTSRKRQVTSKQ